MRLAGRLLDAHASGGPLTTTISGEAAGEASTTPSGVGIGSGTMTGTATQRGESDGADRIQTTPSP